MRYAESPTVILGADGFLGRNLVAQWKAAGRPVHAVGHSAGDFTDFAVVEAAFRRAPTDTGRIIHAITKQRTGPIQYGMQGELLYDNARIHLNVLESWRRHLPAAKLISLGSSCVYPEMSTPIPESALGEGIPHPSVRGYAQAKTLLAVGCETYGSQYGLHWLHCILATVYGPFAHTQPNRSHFMAALISRASKAKAANESHLDVWGSPTTVRDLLYVGDQIDAIIAADGAFTDCVLNVGSNAPVTIGDCVAGILEALDFPIRAVYPQGTFQGATYKTIDSSRFLAGTGWSPRVDLVGGVRRTLPFLTER
jgi:GDP-L-fucose synthase